MHMAMLLQFSSLTSFCLLEIQIPWSRSPFWSANGSTAISAWESPLSQWRGDNTWNIYHEYFISESWCLCCFLLVYSFVLVILSSMLSLVLHRLPHDFARVSFWPLLFLFQILRLQESLSKYETNGSGTPQVWTAPLRINDLFLAEL